MGHSLLQVTMVEEDLVITGFSARFPQADSLAEFKEKLYAGVDFVTDDETRWPRGHLGLPERLGKIRDLSQFDAQFFGIHARQAHMMDPQMRLLLETAHEAIVDAGYEPGTLRGRKIGVFIGCTDSDSDLVHTVDTDKVDGYSLLGNSRGMFANRISYTFDFKGPSVIVDAACSSTMMALNHATLALRSGQCDAAIVGGSMISLKPSTALGFCRLGMLSPDGTCRSFDARGNGFVRSETVGTFFLQRASEARRVYAKLIHVKANADGYKNEGITFPSGKQQEQLLREVYVEAQVDPREMAYIEAHGTGTKVGDPEELGAISHVFCGPGRDRPLLVGAVKSNAGHAEAASGLTSLAKVILAMETGTIAANLHYTTPNPNIPSLLDGSVEVVAKATPFPGGAVGINSFGFGGSSVHAILEPNPGPHVNDVSREKPELPRLVLMAGRTKDSLEHTLERLEAEGPYPDSAYALLNRVGQPSTKQFPYRGFAVVPVDDSGRDVVRVSAQAPFEKRPLWFVFTGMGCQWDGMARQMMQFEVFARSVRKSHDLMLGNFGLDLIEALTVADGEAWKQRAACVLACVAAVQVALVDMLSAVGVSPDGILGHSVGELGCAYADGSFTAEQTVLCAYWRGHCIDVGNMPKGAMAAVGLTWEEVTSRCRDGVVPACHNAEDSVTVSGTAEAVAKMVAELKAENVFAREVDSLDVAFHSPYIQSIGPPLKKLLRKVIPDPKPRSERWVSSSVPQSRWHEPAAKLSSAEYHVNNVLSPVLFSEALEHVPRDAILVEIAPHCLLLSVLRRAVGSGASCLGLMKRNEDNPAFFLKSLGELHTLGVQLDLAPLYPPVPWPVPRGTPSISHLVSWDHTEKWTVVKWSDFPSSAQMSEEVVEVDLEANAGDAYLAGHEMDGRVLFPATGYMMLAWKSLTKRCGKPFHQVPVVFEDVSFHRATILPKRERPCYTHLDGIVDFAGPVKFLVNVMRASGEFEVCEGGTLAASGRIRMAEAGEKLLDKEPPCPTTEASIGDKVNGEDIYKEFRLRGLNYSGSFQGVIEANLSENRGKLKWEDNWVTFIDNMVQFAMLDDTQRRFRLPIKIQSCRIDPDVHVKLAEKVGESGIPIVHDQYLNTYRAGGVVIRGAKTNIAPRRSAQLTARLEEHKFVPYVDDESDMRLRESDVREYVDVCSAITRRILESCGDETAQAPCGLASGHSELSEDVMQRYIEAPAENYILLRILSAIWKEVRVPTSRLHSAVKSALAALEKDVHKDLLNTALYREDPLRSLLDVVVENTSPKRIRILEVVPEPSASLLAPWVASLLNLSNTQLKIEYTVAHPRPDELAPGDLPEVVKVVTWDPASSSANGLPEADFIVVRDLTCGSHRSRALAEQLSAHCRERAFVLLSQRSALSPAESFLSSVGNVPFSHQTTQAVASVFETEGLRVVGLKSNTLSTLLLLRKVPNVVDVAGQEVIRVNSASFAWLETLKTRVLEYHGKPPGQNLWLLAEEAGISGVVGLTNCLLQETGGNHIRCLFDASFKGSSKISDFAPDNPQYKDVLQNDLVMNVYCDGRWGSYRHFTTLPCGAPETSTEFAFLHVQTRGDLSSLQWIESPLRYASPSSLADKVVCSVYYAPLNFKDVMLATGKLSPDVLPDHVATFKCLLGLEFAGRDPQGRRVMGLTSGMGMATAVATSPESLWEVPESWSLEEASTVPVAYATVYYALIVKGDMRPGETLLVHSGSGGVGQAAISVALSMGCTVFTTVGSQEKREFLLRRFPQLQERNIANSRDLSFEDHVLRETKGRGVDLVLNSLAGEKLQASVRCLATRGRFLEIGKFDMSRDSPLGMSVLLKSAVVYGILLESLYGDGPQAVEDMCRVRQLLGEGIASCAVRPLDAIRFARDQAEEAFRFMASGKHIGKVVLVIRPEESPRKTSPASPLSVKVTSRTCFYEHKSYVITGGLGGCGLELADWMVNRGCRKLLLTSRFGVRTGYQRLCLRRLRCAGAKVVVSKDDVSTRQGTQSVIEEAERLGPVGGIFSLAVVLRDAILENQSPEAFETVYKPKADGTWHLDAVSRDLCPELDHFVAFSSVASCHGNVGQTGYGYANAVVERLCERRAADGLPGLAIQWGIIGDVGAMHNMKGADLDYAGYAPQRISSCLAVLDMLLNQRRPVVTSFVKSKTSSGSDEKSPKARDLVETIANIFGVKDASSLDPSTSLGDLGMDSLMGVEVQQTLERDYDFALSMPQIRRLTVAKLREMNNGSDEGTKQQSGSNSTAEPQMTDREREPTKASEVPRLAFVEKMVPDSALVDMNGFKGSSPLFFTHSIQGHVRDLLEIASHLPVPAAGVQWTPDIPVRSIDEMATLYLQRLKEVQLKGPYNLVGYSFGAIVAFEMALQLQSAGESVGSLTLLDGAPKYIAARWSHYQWRFADTKEENESWLLCIFLMQYLDIDFREVRNQLDQCANRGAKEEAVADILFKAFPKLRSSRQDVVTAMRAFYEFVAVATDYEPHAKFQGNVVLVKASSPGKSTRQLPADYGLSQCIDGRVEVKIVDGAHENFVLDPGARECAAIITQQIMG
ncbi:fatty acid synthase-like [Dermacentor andersoni]|uniref:fatty acid synthase-like n=1 Tax=Dermacentor andersoni TaxID=34620 RepID=UPI003B39FDA1